MAGKVQIDKLKKYLEDLSKISAPIEIMDRDRTLAKLVGISLYSDGFEKAHKHLAVQALLGNTRYHVLAWPHLKIITKEGSAIAVLTTVNPNSR